MATEPTTRPLLLDRELCAAHTARIREVIDDLIHLIRRFVLTTHATMPRLPTLLASLTLPPRKLLGLLPRLRPPLLPRLGGILRRWLGARTRILTRLRLQTTQPLLHLPHPSSEIKNELHTRLTPRVIDRLGLRALHNCKIRCTNKESRPQAPTTERLPKAADYQGVSVVGDPGLEPGTSSLSEKRSNRLS